MTIKFYIWINFKSTIRIIVLFCPSECSLCLVELLVRGMGVVDGFGPKQVTPSTDTSALTGRREQQLRSSALCFSFQLKKKHLLALLFLCQWSYVYHISQKKTLTFKMQIKSFITFFFNSCFTLHPRTFPLYNCSYQYAWQLGESREEPDKIHHHPQVLVTHTAGRGGTVQKKKWIEQ